MRPLGRHRRRLRGHFAGLGLLASCGSQVGPQLALGDSSSVPLEVVASFEADAVPRGVVSADGHGDAVFLLMPRSALEPLFSVGPDSSLSVGHWGDGPGQFGGPGGMAWIDDSLEVLDRAKHSIITLSFRGSPSSEVVLPPRLIVAGSLGEFGTVFRLFPGTHGSVLEWQTKTSPELHTIRTRVRWLRSPTPSQYMQVDPFAVLIYREAEGCFQRFDLSAGNETVWGCLPQEFRKSIGRAAARAFKKARRSVFGSSFPKVPMVFVGRIGRCLLLMRTAFPQEATHTLGVDICQRTVRVIGFISSGNDAVAVFPGLFARHGEGAVALGDGVIYRTTGTPMWPRILQPTSRR